MDAFFFGGNREYPKLKGKPVIIGMTPDKQVGEVVSTCSYEARLLVFHSAMSSKNMSVVHQAVFHFGKL